MKIVTDKFDTVEYLRHGHARQQSAYVALEYSGLLSKLSVYQALLVGTVPIGIDVESSDLDIICQYTDPGEFSRFLKDNFGHYAHFKLRYKNQPDRQVVVARFEVQDWAIEIFGQEIATKEQMGYRHLLVEDLVLNQLGEPFRQQIISLKKQGYKTEPAFALMLGLSGDPYAALLALTEVQLAQIRSLI